MVTISGETASLPPDKVARDGELGKNRAGRRPTPAPSGQAPIPAEAVPVQRQAMSVVWPAVTVPYLVSQRALCCGSALSTEMVRPSNSWQCMNAMAVLAARGSEKVTKPKPRLRPVCLSVMTCVQEENSVLRM
jgi:hypothetical protein